MTGMVSSKSYPGHGAVSRNLLLDFNEVTSLVCTAYEKNSKFGRNGNKLRVYVDRAGIISTTSVKSRIESKIAIAQEIKAGNEEVKIKISKMKTKKFQPQTRIRSHTYPLGNCITSNYLRGNVVSYLSDTHFKLLHFFCIAHYKLTTALALCT